MIVIKSYDASAHVYSDNSYFAFVGEIFIALGACISCVLGWFLFDMHLLFSVI